MRKENSLFLLDEQVNIIGVNKFNILFQPSLFLYIIWPALSGFMLHIDVAGRVPILLIIISFLFSMQRILSQPKQIKDSIKILAFLFLYHVVNLQFQGSRYISYNNSPVDLYFAFLSKWCFYCVLILELKNNLKTTLWNLVCAHLLIVLLYMSFGQIFLMAGEFERLYSSVINANNFAFICVSGICISMVLYLYGFIGTVYCGAFYVLFTYCLMATACRTGFVCLLPLTIFFMVKVLWSASAWKKCLCILLFICLFILAFQNIRDSVAYRRMEHREVEQQEYKAGLIGRIMGERSFYVYEGYDLFKTKPLFGVGYGNYIEYSSRGRRNHVEYMAELSEGGIAGFILYLLFLYSLAKPAWNKEAIKRLNMFIALKMVLYIILIIFNLGLFTSLDSTFYIIASLLFVEIEKGKGIVGQGKGIISERSVSAVGGSI